MCLIDWDIFFPFPQQRNSITAGGGLLDQIIRVLGLFLGSQSAGTMLILLPSSGTDSCWNLARHGLPFWDLEPSQQRAAAGDIFLWKLSFTSVCPPAPSGSPNRWGFSLLELPEASCFLQDFHALFLLPPRHFLLSSRWLIFLASMFLLNPPTTFKAFCSTECVKCVQARPGLLNLSSSSAYCVPSEGNVLVSLLLFVRSVRTGRWWSLGRWPTSKRVNDESFMFL